MNDYIVVFFLGALCCLLAQHVLGYLLVSPDEDKVDELGEDD